MEKNRSIAVAALLLWGTAVATAQQQPSSTFDETVEIVVANVDVIVVDRSGVPVSDLTREEFELSVDGKPVEITNFSAYFSPRAVEIEERSIAPKPDMPITQPPPVTWLVYIDLMNMGRTQRQIAMKEMEQFFRATVRTDDRVLVACFDGAALRVLQPLTAEIDGLADIFQRLARRSRPLRDFDGFDEESPVMFSEELQKQRTRASLHAIRNLVTITDAIEGKVALLFAGGGYKLPSPTDSLAARLQSDYHEILQRLASGRVTVYTVYSGSDRQPGVGADTLTQNEPDVDTESVVGGSVEGASELAAFADETGGLAFVAAPALRQGLERVRDDLDGYYSLGFRPHSPTPGRSLAVDVRVRRPELRVRHRDSIRLRTDGEMAQDATMATLLADKPPANPWALAIGVRQMQRTRTGSYHVKVEVRVPLAPVMFVEDESHQKGRLTFHFAVRDAKGNFHQLDERELPLRIPKDEFAAARHQAIRYGIELVLPPGTNDLSITVRDALGHGRSTARTSIETRPGRFP